MKQRTETTSGKNRTMKKPMLVALLAATTMLTACSQPHPEADHPDYGTEQEVLGNLSEHSDTDIDSATLHEAQDIACNILAPGEFQEARWEIQQTFGIEYEYIATAVTTAAGRSECPAAWREALDTTSHDMAEGEVNKVCSDLATQHPAVTEDALTFDVGFSHVEGRSREWHGDATTVSGVPVRCEVPEGGDTPNVAVGSGSIFDQRMNTMFGEI